MTWHAYMQLKIPDICTAIFLENMPQPQATNCRTLNKKYCIVLKNTLVHDMKKWVVGADIPLIGHTNLFYLALRKSTYDVFLTFPVALYFLQP